ncbi:hypothetical protein N7539_003354 [Penicillium diatomitis]|uniref:Carrier domain-containing protein n=1 Tax=Penicillium diatomitis TaxID=2819901 RepID=A0A9W9XBY9_9EURO|nr:uncharacterized protein N7539_003354 [Penicillium diatomitis]KAJ5488464.1 hypothetical protein N7539_003354 [Penicillium diatomitis]
MTASAHSGTSWGQFPPASQNGRSKHKTMDRQVVCESLSSPIKNEYIFCVAWAIVLACHTHSDEVLFGVAWHGRQTETGDQAILPWRLRIDSGDTVADALAATARYHHEMRGFEHMGIQKFSMLCPENIRLCQFGNLIVLGCDSDDVSEAQKQECQYPLALYVGDSRILANFDPSLVEPDRLRMMLIHVLDVVQAMVDMPDRTIHDIRTAGRRGITQMRQLTSLTEPESDDTAQVQQLIDERCASCPSALAVCAWDGSVTYGELGQWAWSVARGLVDNGGIGPGSFVGIFMAKSVKTVVAMLGIMRAGAAFLFLPLSVPIERLRTMCSIANVQCVVTAKGKGSAAATHFGLPVFEVPETPVTAESTSLINSAIGSDPLYAVFTSGSSGQPKGIVVDRASYGPGLRDFCALTRLHAQSRVLHAVSHAFVVNIIEQFAALATGACLCVPSEEQIQVDLETAISQFNATWGILTPSVARLLRPANVPSMQSLLLAGESVVTADVTRWSSSSACLYSVWGQSESASTLLVRQLHVDSPVGSLGLPTTGRYWVVDPENPHRLLPMGLEGELLLESSALARGYFGNSTQTERTFLNDPNWYSSISGSQSTSSKALPRRWLLTGDLVRFCRMDGSLDFVGRKGTRTKIRGQRVELGEIESQLQKSLPGSQQVVAELIVPAPGPGEEQPHPPPMLVAFTCNYNQVNTPSPRQELVAETPTAESRSTARVALSALRQVLPSYMVPSAILSLSFLPRTVTGKIDRRALREWSGRRTVDEMLNFHEERMPFRAPETDAERTLQECCEKVLHLAPGSVGLEDNFLGLGGNSLTAQQLVTASRSSGLRIGMTDVFEKPTLGALAATGIPCSFPNSAVNPSKPGHAFDEDLFETLKTDVLRNGVLGQGLEPEDVEHVYPTLEMQSLLVDLAVLDYFPIEIDGIVDSMRLKLACQRFVDLQPSLRSFFIQFREQTMQIVLRQLAINWTELALPSGADLMTWTRSWALQDRTQPPPLSRPSAAGFTLIKGNNDSQQSAFVLRLPHAQYDGVCLRQIVQQLGALYNNPDLFDATQSPFADFTSYRRACARLRTPVALDFWRELLSGSEVTRLPRLSLGSETSVIYSGECEPLSPPTGITMATAIKAAWAFVIAQETNKTDVVFGQITNCRGNIDIDPEERAVGRSGSGQEIIGMCLNTTPVRVRLSSTTRVKELLLAVQRQHVRMLPYETIDWFDMVANSTPWPADTDLDSVVLHENFASAGDVTLGKALGRMDNPIFTTPGWKRHALVTWPGADKLMTFLMIREGALDKTYAEGLVRKFNETLVRFLGDPEGLVSGSTETTVEPQVG